MTTTTFRKDAVDGMVTILESFMASYPTRIYSVSRVGPGDFSGAPLIYVADRDERLGGAAGMYTRQMSLSVILVDSYADRETFSTRNDETVDLLIGHFWDNERTILTNGVFALSRVDDRELRVGDAVYPITVFTFSEPGDLVIGRG